VAGVTDAAAPVAPLLFSENGIADCGEALYRTEMVSKPQITFKGKAQLDVKAEHIQ
jgi:hypothetical protein